MKDLKTVSIYNKHNFGIAKLCSKEDRYDVYNTIHLTKDFTEVTNGHYLVRIESIKENPEDLPSRSPDDKPIATDKIEVLIPMDTATAIEKALPRNPSISVLKNAWLTGRSNEKATDIMTTDLESDRHFTIPKNGNRYATTEKIWPEDKNKVISIGFNPDYMKKLCDIFTKQKLGVIKLSLYGTDAAMLLEGNNIDTGQKTKMLLMPKKS